MAKAAKKAPKRAQADQSPTEPRGSTEPSADNLTTHNAPDQLRLTQLRADIAGRTFRALKGLVKDEDKHVRVLGWITWLFLLVLLGGFAVAVTVLVFRWHPLYTIASIGGSTVLVAGANLVDRHLRRRR
jgi:hypothetical protein